jgi:predicted RNA methylase
MKRKQLEMLLSTLRANPRPRLKFEEYSLDPTSASTIVYLAAALGDVEGKRVIDLGCGIGVLSLGIALMGAMQVVGVDIDKDLIRIAEQNMIALGVRVEFISGTIECVRGQFDTTIMNPPFGSWKRGLDLQFLYKAVAISGVVYSMHKASESSDAFLHKKVSAMGKEVRKLGRVEVIIPHLYGFHKKAKYRVGANLYRIASRRD